MKVAIIGAGPAGLFSACQLKYSSVTVFETNEKAVGSLRPFSISAQGMRYHLTVKVRYRLGSRNC